MQAQDPIEVAMRSLSAPGLDPVETAMRSLGQPQGDQDTSYLGLAGYSFGGAAQDIAGGAMHSAGVLSRMTGEIAGAAGFEGVESALGGAGEYLQENAPRSGEEGFIPDVMGGLGSTATFGLAAVPLVLGGAPAGAVAASMAVVGAITVGGEEFYTQLDRDPEDRDKAWRMFWYGTPGGALEGYFPMGKLLSKIDKASGGKLRQGVARAMLEVAGEEGGVEALQAAISEGIALHAEAEDISVLEGVYETLTSKEGLKKVAYQGAVGAFAGGGATVIGTGIAGAKHRLLGEGTGTDRAPGPDAKNVPEAGSPPLSDPDAVPEGWDPAKFKAQVAESAPPAPEVAPDDPGESAPPEGAQEPVRPESGQSAPESTGDPRRSTEAQKAAPEGQEGDPQESTDDPSTFAGETKPKLVKLTEEEIAEEMPKVEGEMQPIVKGNREAGYRGKIREVVEPENPGIVAKIAKKAGLKIRWIEGEGQLPVAGSYSNGTAVIDVGQHQGATVRSLVAHEFSHFMRATLTGKGGKPDAWQALVVELAAINVNGKNVLGAVGAQYQARLNAAMQGEVSLEDQAFIDEAVANLMEQAPQAIMDALGTREGAESLAQTSPTLFRKVIEWLKGIAKKMGRGDQWQPITDLEAALGEGNVKKVGEAWLRAVDALGGVEAVAQGAPVVSGETVAPEAEPAAEDPDAAPFALSPPPDSAAFRALRQASVPKGRVDRLRRHSETLSDLLVSPAFQAQGFRGLDAPAQREVLSGVLAFGENGEVLDAVVSSLPVDVVDILRGQQLAPEVLLSDRSVLKDFLSRDGDGSVSTRGGVTDALVRAVALVSAELSGAAAQLPGTATNVDSAASAGDGGSVGVGHTPSVPLDRGTYSSTDPDIRKALAPAPTSDLSIPQGTSWDAFVQMRQNTMHPFWRAARATGDERFKEVHGRATRYMDKAVFRHKRFRNKYWDPLFKHIKGNWSEESMVRETGRYLYARHAQERNAEIDRRRQDSDSKDTFPGSGMSDAQAQSILDELHAGPKAAAYRKLGKLWDAANSAHLDMSVEYGLISQEYADHLQEIFPHYAPLKNAASDEEASGFGFSRGADVRGKEFRTARGRMTKASDLIAHAMEAVALTTVRGEKNQVAQGLLSWLRENRARVEDFATFRKPRRVSMKTTTAGDNVMVWDNAEPDSELIVGIKEEGVEYRIEFKPEYADFAKALHVLTAEQLDGVTRSMGHVTRYLASVNTRWNPVFPIFNAVRDAGAAFFTSQEHGFGFSMKVLGDMPKAFSALMGRGSEQMKRELEMYRDDGVQMAFMGLDEVRGSAEVIAKEMADIDSMTDTGPSGRKALKKVQTMLETWGDAVENAARLSAYVNAKESLKMTRDQAADYAKDITTNFRRKGLRGSHMNAWYMFSNAGLQGTERVARALKTRGVQNMVAGSIVTSAALSLISRMTSDEDEDGERYYDAIPDYVKRTNIIIPIDGKRFLRIPAPFVFNVFNAVGNHIGDAAWEMATGEDTQSIGRAVGDLATALVDSTSPFGGADPTLAHLVSPTIADPILDIATNQDFAGRNIARQPFPGQTSPRSRQFWPDVNPTTRQITTWLNKQTGGDEFEAGAVDVNPEHVEAIGKFLTGGLGATLGRILNVGDRFVRDEDIPTKDIPLIRRIINDPSPWALNSRFKEAVEEVGVERKRKEKGSDHDAALARLYTRARTAERRIKKRRERLQAEDDRDKQKRLESEIRDIQAEFNRTVREARGS